MADRPVQLDMNDRNPRDIESMRRPEIEQGKLMWNFQIGVAVYAAVLLTVHTIFVGIIMGFGSQAASKFL